MKPLQSTLLLVAGLLLLIDSPVRAQEKPSPQPPPSDAPARPDNSPPPPPVNSRGEHPRGPQSRNAEERPTPFIGVLTSSVSPELRAQFDLPEGFGLQVVEVMPDTPAKTAGLKEHDILLQFDDQKLVNMEQLQTLVRSKKKDDVVNFTIISGGKQSQVPIKVGERMMPVNMEEGRGRNGRFFPMNPRAFGFDRGGDHFSGGNNGYRSENDAREAQETLERFQERMRDFQKRFNEWSRNRTGEMPTPPMLDGPRHREWDRRGGPGSTSRNGSSNDRRDYTNSGTISRRDESGEYLLRRDGDRTVFTVKPKEGSEQSWNVNDDTERAAVPEQYRAKLKMLEDIRKDMRRDVSPSPGPRENDHGPRDNDRRPPPDDSRRKDETPPPSENSPGRRGGTI